MMCHNSTLALGNTETCAEGKLRQREQQGCSGLPRKFPAEGGRDHGECPQPAQLCSSVLLSGSCAEPREGTADGWGCQRSARATGVPPCPVENLCCFPCHRELIMAFSSPGPGCSALFAQVRLAWS